MNNINYTYVLIGTKYWCLHQNLLKLLCYKFFKKDIFVDKELNLKFFLKFIWYRLRLSKEIKTRVINHKGQFLIPVHGGVKLFDIYNNRVIKKYFIDSADNIFDKELNQLKLIQKLNCTPQVIKINQEQKFYEEFYSRGIFNFEKHLKKDQDILKAFDAYLLPLLEKIIQLENPIQIPLSEYLKQSLDKINQSALIHMDHESFSIIDNFLNHITDNLKHFTKFNIFLSLTHGDLTTKNIIITTNGIKLIDWEFLKKRSFLFDFYNFFFHLVRKNIRIEIDLNSVVDNCFASLKIKFKPYLSEHGIETVNTVYRLLYYLERIYTFLEFRKLVEPKKKLNNILYNIEVFKSHELILKSI